MAVLDVEHVGADTTVAGQGQLTMGDQVHRHPGFHQVDVGPCRGLPRQGAGDSLTGGIGGMDDAAMAVAALAGQVQLLVLVPGKGNATVHQPVDALATVLDGEPDRILMAQAGAGGEGVPDVVLQRVLAVQYRGDAALGPEGGATGNPALADDGDAEMFGKIQRNGEAGRTTANN